MRVSIEQVGASPQTLIAAQAREVAQASRKAANAIKNAGVAAVRKAAPYKSFAGYPLKVKGKVLSSGADGCEVRVYGYPVGFWSMLESGRRGGYTIKPRTKQALHGEGGPFSEGHTGGAMAGKGAWSATQPALRAAVDKTLTKVYGEALD